MLHVISCQQLTDSSSLRHTTAEGSLGAAIYQSFRQCLQYRWRSEDRPLWRPACRSPAVQSVHDVGLQKLLHQRDHRVIGHVFPQFRDEAVMRDGVEVRFQVHVDGVPVTSPEQRVHATQRVFASPVGAKAVAVFRELSFKDRFRHMA